MAATRYSYQSIGRCSAHAPVHLIGVSLDLGGNRRGVDMGPSAFRIAGLAERLTALGHHRRRRRRSGRADSRGQVVRRSEEEVHPRDRARLREALQDVARRARERRVPARARRRSQPRRRDRSRRPPTSCGATGKPLGLIWVDAHGDMNTPASSRQRQRARHAARVAARPGAGGAVADRRLLAEGRARAHRAHRHPQSRRAREGDRPRVGRARLHDEGHRSRRASRPSSNRRSRSPARAPPASTSRSISTSAIRRSRPASARRSRAASTTARRTW